MARSSLLINIEDWISIFVEDSRQETYCRGISSDITEADVYATGTATVRKLFTIGFN